MDTGAHGRSYLPPSEAAAYLGVTRRTLTEWRRTRRGPRYIRLGGLTGRVRYELSQLDEFMRRRQHTHTVAERSSVSHTAGRRLPGAATSSPRSAPAEDLD